MLIQLPLQFPEPERWRDVPGYEGIYEVSDKGRVRTLVTRVRGYKAGTLLKQGTNVDGYKTVTLLKDGVSQQTYVHRIVMLSFVGEPGEHEVNHKNGVKDDNRLENLEYMSHGDNMRHAVYELKVYRPYGERHPRARLTDEDVQTIRARFAGGAKRNALANEYGLTPAAIYQIVNRRTWKHIA